MCFDLLGLCLANLMKMRLVAGHRLKFIKPSINFVKIKPYWDLAASSLAFWGQTMQNRISKSSLKYLLQRRQHSKNFNHKNRWPGKPTGCHPLSSFYCRILRAKKLRVDPYVALRHFKFVDKFLLDCCFIVKAKK